MYTSGSTRRPAAGRDTTGGYGAPCRCSRTSVFDLREDTPTGAIADVTVTGQRYIVHGLFAECKHR